MLLKNRSIRTLLLSCLLAMAGLIYLPGISGPYTFDDFPNLLANSYVQINSLDAESLYHAAYSLAAGPLMRPVSMLSFALNHYFAGSFNDPTPYKLTNILLHTFNGLLVFWMTQLIFTRLKQTNQQTFVSGDYINARTLGILSAVVAALWITHPIQVTSVLYVVQRMTSLSGLFVILGLICYLKGRMRLISGKQDGVWIILLGLLGCGIPGILSKENAVLLPLFMLVLEFVLFSSEKPWKLWRTLSRRTQVTILVSVVLLSLTGLILAINYALPNYIYRQFNMLERVLTESRVLFFYISLILVPRIDKFGIFHDDLEISTSLFSPWTTLPSVLGLIFLLLVAIVKRKEWPLFALGSLWFFTAHLLESTILALEIAHEHRNYLATYGVLLVCLHMIDRGSHVVRRKELWLLLPLMILTFAGITYFRALQWANPVSLYHYEALHSPNSSSAQAGLGMRLVLSNQYDEGMKALRRASELEPSEASYLLNMHMVTAEAGKELSDLDHEETVNRLTNGHVSASTILALQFLGECISSACASLQSKMETWLRLLLKRSKSGGQDASLYYHLLGRTLAGQGKLDEAINAYKSSYQLDQKYLHPLFELGHLYLVLQRIDDAEATLRELRYANQGNKHPRDADIENFSKEIVEHQKLRQVKPRS